LKKLLIIGHTFPEPSTTAAGRRMMQLISLFKAFDWQIAFATNASPSEYSEHLELHGIDCHSILLNDASVDAWLLKLAPDAVLFDRFLTEEQFGWKVVEQCPDALRILDTEDLHFLRKAREIAFKNNEPVNFYTETAKRELASILRCDLSLIISSVEMELLSRQFHIPENVLFYLPLFVDEIPQSIHSFEERKHFITVGNFQHAPNADSVIYLKESLWPEIRKSIPEAQLHCYGAYVPKNISSLHDEKNGFLIQGWLEDLDAAMKQARVCLAPLRFGAGIKGKIMDATCNGTPVVTTNIGAEGMSGLAITASTEDDFIQNSLEVYLNKNSWGRQQQQAFHVLEHHFLKSNFQQKFFDTITWIQKNLKTFRENHFIGQILQHQSLQATKYLGKWIELKNKQL